MQDGYKNIMFDIIQRGRETIAEHCVVRNRLRGAWVYWFIFSNT